MRWSPKRSYEYWKYQVKNQRKEKMREALKPRVGKPLFQEADGEIKLNWFTRQLDTEYQVKCQTQRKNYKICKRSNYAKSSNGFHSKGLSVSDFSLFTSEAEQKLRTSEGSMSPHVVFDSPRNLLLPVRKEANRLYGTTYSDHPMCSECYTFQSTFTSILLINVPNYFEKPVMPVSHFKRILTHSKITKTRAIFVPFTNTDG